MGYFTTGLAWPGKSALAGSVPSTASLASHVGLGGVKQRNTVLDGLFYDVPNLSPAEVSALTREVNVEGSILVVWPTGARDGLGVTKFNDHAALVEAPGRMLQRFAIAGVGSSDLGAAAFARTVADRYGEPVGAIVAGYGVADLLSEALGGWFVLGGANRLMHTLHRPSGPATGMPAMKGETAQATVDSVVADSATPTHDTIALYNVLTDPHREVRSIAGHSKGCLSIAAALSTLVGSGDGAAIEKARKARITTCGAVVSLPSVITNVGQYLGSIDWFGGLNSRPDVPFDRVDGAWHHLNTSLPFHMDFATVLEREPD